MQFRNFLHESSWYRNLLNR